MEASNVYYTDFRCPVGTSLLEKLRRLCLAAGIRQLDMEGKFVFLSSWASKNAAISILWSFRASLTRSNSCFSLSS